MNQLTKVTSNIFNDVHVDFFQNENGEIIMTAEQIGSALEYADPGKSILKIYERNKERLERYSTTVNLTALDGKIRNVRIFNEKGVIALIMMSNKSKAVEFQDWVYDVIQQIRKSGFYMATTDVKVPELLSKVNELEQRLESFVTLNSHEASTLQKSINRRVCEVEPDKDARRNLFSELHREIRDRFGVPSYRDVARLDFQNAVNYVKNWIPKRVA